MIIAFLQLQTPPVVPALHQRPNMRRGKKDGEIAPFGDDLDRLRGHGDQNKSTLGELLFQFFRFYAHEFDYDTSAVSVRLGKLMPKSDRKSWILAINNRLCVEEPFNTMRNLGNTADDTSFRGIHLELRRAFDLISEGKLEECCEQYVFPKEEEKLFQKPASIPRPALIRSASNPRNTGGNSRRGGRQQGQFRANNNHGNNRRASSSTAYDNNANLAYYPGYPYVGNDGMFMAVAQTLSDLQLQENQLRFLQYTHGQALAQQQQVLTHAQRMQGNVSQPQTSTERSRTNSFDNPPMSAPIRPEVWYWQQFQGQPYYATPPSFTSYPTSPSSQQTAEQRRTSHRSSNASEAGTAGSGSALRSHSQPASRSASAAQPIPGVATQTPAVNGAANIPTRQLNGRAIPSFISDESNDVDPSLSANPISPEEDKYRSLHLDPSTSPAHKTNGTHAMLPAFGDLSLQGSNQSNQGRRRLSSDQFPQSILDRIKRTSRSPSPLGHNRANSTGNGSTPLASAPFTQSTSRLMPEAKPVVVNGSAFNLPSAVTGRNLVMGDVPTPPEAVYSNNPNNSQQLDGTLNEPQVSPTQVVTQERPVVVNGSCPAPSALLQGIDGSPAISNGSLAGSPFQPLNHSSSRISSAAFQRGAFVPGQPQSPLMALDLATDRMQPSDPHLSPINETTPSPTASRNFELPSNPLRARPSISSSINDSKPKPKTPVEASSSKLEAAHASNPRVNGLAKENGHTRGAKSENDNTIVNGWQKISKTRKKGGDGRSRGDIFPQSEQPPKNESERKGG